MSKTANFDNKKGSFGNYGGTKSKFRNRTLRGYYQTECVVCKKKAIYHCGGDGYCREHKELAVQRRIKYRDTRELISNDWESRMAEFDKQDLQLMKAKKYPSVALKAASRVK